MPTFQELMAYSKSQTNKSEDLAAQLLAKKKKEEAQRKQQQALEDQRERDRQEKLRKKHFEDLQRQEQRKRDLEKAKKAAEAELKRREDEARDRLLGARPASHRAPRSRTAGSSGGGAGRKTTKDDDDMGDASVALTRQEKRDRKLQADLNRTYNTHGRSKTTGGYVRSGRKLPGGAVDAIFGADGTSSGSNSGARSAKQRLSQMPNTLTKLNTVKRDTRTIDEILRDRAKAKSGEVLEGDKAKQFDDWFTPAKRPTSLVAPKSKSSSPALTKPVNTAKSTTSSGLSMTSKSIPSKSNLPPFTKSASRPAKASAAATKVPAKKRQRSATPPDDDGLFSEEDEYEDDYDDAPPSKRRVMDHRGGPGGSSLGDTIWSLFGKSRSSYVSKDILSDDEDMEVDARILEAEELSSARLAKKEDQIALEEERRHEEEKRRRKKMGGRI